jgi:glycine oxidase
MPRADVLIVGQGLAGTLLGWELERAGISFAIADAGQAGGASRVAAGIINPITGRRLVKSWRIDALLPVARAAYRAIEVAVGVPLWHGVRVRRLFADAREREVFATKQASGELAPYAGDADAEGFWIEGGARVDLTALLDAARERWRSRGWWREEAMQIPMAVEQHALVIDCTGAAIRRGASGGSRNAFDFVPWEFSKGELLEISVDGLTPGVVLNCGHWILPVAPGNAFVGATHEPGVIDTTPTAVARAQLEASARRLLARPFVVRAHRAGVRVNLPDKRPVVGRHPMNARLGVFNGLGAKGALLAPELARQWARHLTTGVVFDAEMAVGRFGVRI